MSSPLRRVAVFCASADGVDPDLGAAAYDVGAGLAGRGIGLVYGGGGKGLMGRLSQGALDAGGEVIGVIPRAMVEREWGRDDLTRLHVVETMHERKALMAEHADAFLCLPGGLGTLEEIFEVWSWRQIDFSTTRSGSSTWAGSGSRCSRRCAASSRPGSSARRCSTTSSSPTPWTRRSPASPLGWAPGCRTRSPAPEPPAQARTMLIVPAP